jgi:hypothetical protein
MSANTSGPVKPPVLDLKPNAPADKPRTGGSRRAASVASGAAESKAETPDTAPIAARASGLDFDDTNTRLALAGTAAAGAVLGLAAAYLLALAGLWPGAADADPRLDALEARLAEPAATVDLAPIEERLVALESGGSAEIEALRGEIEALAARPLPEGGAMPDLSGIEDRLAALESAPAPAAPDAVDLSPLELRLAALETQLVEQRAAVSRLSATPDPAPADDAPRIAALVRLPLLISSFEAAVTAGRPFSAELDALRAALPEVEIAPTLIAASGNGVLRADALAQEFSAALPDMLAARPNGEGGPMEAPLDWLGSVIALRPAGEIPGDGPDALISQVEANLRRADYIAADTAFNALPEPMRRAAGSFADRLAERADAQMLGETLRRRALAGTEGSAS